MMTKIFVPLIGLACICAAVGFAVLAIWDVPVEQTQVEKTLDNSRFLQKSL
ncbi:MAG: hypothetical protein OXT65_03160 [Alphaproteobacteria bacterium]|nr:hypothetical protein [Alphaproteobacteria bacterium]